MSRQRAEATLELKKKLLEQQTAAYLTASTEARQMVDRCEEQFTKAVQAQAQGFQTGLDEQLAEQTKKIYADMQASLMHEVAVVRQRQTEDFLFRLLPALEEAAGDVVAAADVASRAMGSAGALKEETAATSAILSLEAVLTSAASAPSSGVLPSPSSVAGPTAKPTKQLLSGAQLAALRAVCASSALSTAVLGSLPERVLTEGMTSATDLQLRFKTLRAELRKAALSPQNAPNKMVGQVIGSALAAVSWSPSGYSTGEGVEDVLSRAAFFVERARFKEALKELDQVRLLFCVLCFLLLLLSLLFFFF